MWKNFSTEYKDAIATRRRGTDFPISWIVSTLVVLVAVYILGSIFFKPTDELPDFNFADEQGTITALSAILLVAGAAFSFVAFFLSNGDLLKTRLFWILASVGLGILALDEVLQLHQQIGDRIDAWGITAGPVRRWNDIIEILYGVFALAFLAIFFTRILRFPWFVELLAVAFLFFLIQTVIDSFTDPPTIVSVIWEESAKLYCSTFISLAFLVGMVAVGKEGRQQASLTKVGS